jgi:hypothetical protein
MLQVLENTPTRLVIRLTQRLNVSTLIFDKSSGRARFERAVLFWKRKPVDIALDDIESIAAVPVGAGGSETYVPLVQLKSGGKFQPAEAGTQAEAVEAVGQMSTFLEMAPDEGEMVAAAADEPVRSPVRRRVIALGSATAGAVVLIIAGVWLTNKLSLPGCDAELARTAITGIFDEKKVKLDALADVRTLTSARSEKTCQARADIVGGFFNLDYRIEWEGWKARVMITRAEAMAKIEPARLGDIRRAVSDFLDLAKDSHTTGRAPRQSDPAVKAMLDAVFDTSDLDGATLAASDVGRALDWFAAGDRIGVVYILAGTGVTEISKLPNDPNIQRRTHRNVAEFAPEFARYLDFEVKLAGAMADATLKRMAGATPDELERPEMKKDVAEVRSTLRDAMTGALTSLAYEGVSDEWRRDRLAVLMEVAPKAAKFLNPEQGRAVRTHALNVVGYVRNTFVQDTLRAFAEQVAAQ